MVADPSCARGVFSHRHALAPLTLRCQQVTRLVEGIGEATLLERRVTSVQVGVAEVKHQEAWVEVLIGT